MSERAFKRTSVPLPHFLSSASFEQMLRTAFSQKAKAPGAKRIAARDQALLRVLFETGITVSETCALRVADLDPKTGLLHVRGRGGRERQMILGPTCLSHLRWYLRQMAPTTRKGLARRMAGDDPLFGTEGKQSLTKNGVTMVFARFRKRAGISDATITPQVLRHSFALRYLQAGGPPEGLQELLGYEGMAPVRQYLRWYDQPLHEQTQQKSEEVWGSVEERATPSGSKPDGEGTGGKTLKAKDAWCAKLPPVGNRHISSLFSDPGWGSSHACLDMGRQIRRPVPHSDHPLVIHADHLSVWSKTTNALEAALYGQRRIGKKRIWKTDEKDSREAMQILSKNDYFFSFVVW
jgi:site-specific recombinase XerD